MKLSRRIVLVLLAIVPMLRAAKPVSASVWKARVGDATVIQEGKYVTVACNGAAIRIDTEVA